MQITVNVSDEMAAEVEPRLASEADARGLPLETYILEKLVGREHERASQQRTVEEAIEGIRELRKGNRLNGLQIKELIEEGRR